MSGTTSGSSTCLYASWLDQRRSTSPWSREKSFPRTISSTDAIADPAACEQRYNAVAKAFDRRFTRDDLDELLARIAAHEAAAPTLYRLLPELGLRCAGAPHAWICKVQPAGTVEGLFG